MRITSSMYNNIYERNENNINKSLFNVNKQISSTLKIQYAYEDITTFSSTMRLDNEITTLSQNKASAEGGYKFSNQTDNVLNDFETSLDRMKTLLIQSTDSVQNSTSRDAIAKELRGIEKYLKNLANTSIDGKYLFSGSAIDIKPISDDGKYMGNDKALNSFAGSQVVQQYNISGAEFFLGNKNIEKEISTNVSNYNVIKKYPTLKGENLSSGVDEPITPNSTIRELMGDLDNQIDKNNVKHHFYIRGTTSSGVAFTKQISMKDDEKVGDLLNKIGEAYGNTQNSQVVNVSLNNNGQIVIQDKIKGSSKLDFQMVGATDFEYNGVPSVDKADILNASAYGVSELGDIENLTSGESDFGKILNGTSSAIYSKLYIKNFVKSDFSPADTFENKLVNAKFSMSASVSAGETLSIGIKDKYGTVTTYSQAYNIDAATTYNDLKTQLESNGNFKVTIVGDTFELNTTPQGIAKGVIIDSNLANNNPAISVTTSISTKSIQDDLKNILYDDTQFSRNGSKLSSNIYQIIKNSNQFATASTKISQVADISHTYANSDLDGKQLVISGNDINGNKFDVKLDFKNSTNGGSTFTLGANIYTMYNMGNPRTAVDANDMTYQQLMDVVNMVTTGNLPTITAPATTNTANEYDQAIQNSNYYGTTYLTDDGRLEFSDMHNTSTKASISIHDKNSGNFSTISAPSFLSFNANNALVTRDSKTDFFKTIDEVIKSVEDNKFYADASSDNPRGIGMQDAIKMIDDLMIHTTKIHSKVGTQSNVLDSAIQRIELLKINTISLRSSVIDTDVAEAFLQFNQLNKNYEYILLAAGKVSKLSLVNYL